MQRMAYQGLLAMANNRACGETVDERRHLKGPNPCSISEQRSSQS